MIAVTFKQERPTMWRALIAVILTTVLMAQCGKEIPQTGPLPTNGKERPLLPGCKQLRAEGGEC